MTFWSQQQQKEEEELDSLVNRLLPREAGKKNKKKTRPIRTPHDTTSKNIIRTQVEKCFLIATQLNYVYLGIQIYILSMKFSKWYTGGPLKQLG